MRSDTEKASSLIYPKIALSGKNQYFCLEILREENLTILIQVFMDPALLTGAQPWPNK